MNRLLALLIEHKPGSQATPTAAAGTRVRDVHIGDGDFTGRDKIQAAFGQEAVIIGGNAQGLRVGVPADIS